VNPFLSVAIPTYNGESYLRAMLDSVCAQDSGLLDKIELLVVDDGSTDRTLDIIEAYSTRLPLRLLRSARTSNWVKGANECFLAACGDYITILHQDDIWFPDRLAVLHRALSENEGIAGVVHDARFISAKGHVIGTWRCPFSRKEQRIDPDYFFRRLLVQNFLSIGAPVFRRDLLGAVGLMDETLWYTPDWDYWLRIFGCFESLYVNRCLTGFRVHKEAQTIQGSGRASFSHELCATKDLAIKMAKEPLDRGILKVASFSCSMNIFLAGSLHGVQWRAIREIVSEAAGLTMSEWALYLKNSRIIERVGARLRLL
jgi:glycosyltransferase involved in cell wall biosynthesis